MDYSGLIIAAANLDKNVRLIDYYSGVVQSTINVGEVATGLAFTPDCKHLLVTTQDGCIFIYKLPKELIK